MKKFLNYNLFSYGVLNLAILFLCWSYCYVFHQIPFSIIIGILLFLLNTWYCFGKSSFLKWGNLFLKYRYLIALVVFVLLVLFKISGSSIGMYNEFFPQDGIERDAYVLFGKSQGVRSDEYVVQTPYYFSQYYNHFGRTSYQMSLGGQDMIIGYNSPVLDISILAKPLVWGYVLFGPQYGLSWYWCLKVILFLLVMYELFMILTKGKKALAVLGSLLVTYAPTIQWFFVPHISDVFLWGMTLVVLGYYFFTAKKRLIKYVTSVLTPLAAIGFVLALYPPLQVPIGLMAIALLIFFLIRDKKEITFQKKEIWKIVLMFLFAFGVILYEFWLSKDAILLLYQTDYPGSRMEVGGYYLLKDLFPDLANLFLPYKSLPYSNACEVSDFYHLGPVCLLLFAFISQKLKKKDLANYRVGVGLIAVLCVEMVFMLAGFPELLSKLTLFSFVNRMESVYGFTAVLFTIYFFYVLSLHDELLSKKEKIISVLLFFFSYFLFITNEQKTFVPIFFYVLEILLFTSILFFALWKKHYLAYGLTLSVILFACFAINPITRGSEALTNHEIVREVAGLPKSKTSTFLTADNIVTSSLLLANGYKVLNAVNYYPDFDKWNLLDPEGNYKTYYNRYLHEVIDIVEEETSYSLITPDSISVHLNLLDIEKLPVDYVLTYKMLENMKDYSSSHFTYISTANNIQIYKIDREI